MYIYFFYFFFFHFFFIFFFLNRSIRNRFKRLKKLIEERLLIYRQKGISFPFL